MPDKAKPNLCVVCGARANTMNSRNTTCDNICTRARDAGITREQQLDRDMHEHPWTDEPSQPEDRGYFD